MKTIFRHPSLKVLTASTLLSAALLTGSFIAPANSAQSAVQPAAAPLIPQSGFADLIERVQPSVVTIRVSKATNVSMKGQRYGDPRAQEFFERFFDPGRTPAPESRQAHGEGSGFVIDTDGYIVTNNHVIDGAQSVTVVLSDGTNYEAEVVGSDAKTDLALLKISVEGLSATELGDSDTTRVGDWVVAIGNPFGLGGTATVGIVSARSRDIQSGPYDDYLQIDAPINQGNSGGPIFNAYGEVVGVNTAIYSPNGGNVGIAFAIPANMVEGVVEELRSNGSVDRGWLGIQLQDLDQDLAEGLELDSTEGVLVADVVQGSPAEQAGIKVGDVVTAIDSLKVKDAKALSRRVGASDSGDRVTISVIRRGQPTQLKVQLGDAEHQQLAAHGIDSKPLLGLSLRPAPENLSANKTTQDRGLVVADVDPESVAAKLGVRPGDRLVQADGDTVPTLAALAKTIDSAAERGKARITVLLQRGSRQTFIALPIA